MGGRVMTRSEVKHCADLYVKGKTDLGNKHTHARKLVGDLLHQIILLEREVKASEGALDAVIRSGRYAESQPKTQQAGETCESLS